MIVAMNNKVETNIKVILKSKLNKNEKIKRKRIVSASII